MRRFAKSENGNIAIMTAFGMLVTLGVAGAAVDFSMVSSSSSRSQNIADVVALNAASFVRMNNEIPTAGSAEGVAPGDYKASDFGFDYQGWVYGGADSVNVNVAYNVAAREAIVTVSGKTVSMFSQIIGKNNLDFSSESVVNFETIELKDVASVALVLDNSGSMAWDDKAYTNNGAQPPTNATQRLTALENSVINFMDYLSPLVGNQSETGERILRTGMLAYNTSTIVGRTKLMDWRLLSNSNINTMSASGGTNPTDSMAIAASWMIGEPAIHQAENGKTPLRYVVLMTDGVNNNNNSSWIDQSDTDQWRRSRCQYNWGWSCWYEYEGANSKPSDYVGYWNNGYRYDYDWEEGRWTRPDDEATLAHCETLKNGGVTVYTIGFGLQPGKYDTNSGNNTTYIDADTTDQAYEFLAQCATDASTFITANNADELQGAFDTIGADIVAEVIRIKS
jgi:hypothetical protein